MVLTPERVRNHRGGPGYPRHREPYFWILPSDSFFQQRAYKLANVSHTLVSKVETIAVCEKERVAHVCCAALGPSACPCTLIVVSMRILFPKKKIAWEGEMSSASCQFSWRNSRYIKKSKSLDASHRILFPPNKKYFEPPVGGRWAPALF